VKIVSRRTALGLLTALGVLSLGSGVAQAAWETAKPVDNQGSSAGATGSYVGLAEGSNGIATAFFSQVVNGKTGYYAVRRGASAAAWSAPAQSALSGAGSGNPIVAAADGAGNALSATAQGGAIFASIWPVSVAGPSDYSSLLTDSNNSGLSDPALAFDSRGNGYAVAGQQIDNSSFGDAPIWLATYSPKTQSWSPAAPVSVAGMTTATTCDDTGSLATKPAPPAGTICGEEPRLAVSPDGTVVIVFLEGCSSATVPGTTNCSLWAVRAPRGAVASSGAGAFVDYQQISGNPVEAADQPGGTPSSTPANYDVAIDGADTATIVAAESSSGVDYQVSARQWPASMSKPQPAATISSSPPPLGAAEPRVVADAGGDVTAVWAESSTSSPPPTDALMSAEVINGAWTAPEAAGPAADGPTGPQGYALTSPTFALAENSAGDAYLVYTNSGTWMDAIRQLGKAWSAAGTISGVSSAVAGTARVAVGLNGQADAMVINNGSRPELYASRFTVPLPAPTTTNPPPQGPPANGSKNPPAPTYRTCYARPTSRIRHGHISRRGISVAGTATENPCADASPASRSQNHVVKVYVSIYRPAKGGRCRFLLPSGRLTKPLPCTRPVEFLATGTGSWRLVLRARIPAGFYLIRSDAVDGFGRHQVRSSASVIRVVLKLRKRHPARRAHHPARRAHHPARRAHHPARRVKRHAQRR
jgi:hypothetical protein